MIKRLNKKIKYCAACVILLAVWQLAAMIIGEEFILASPITAAATLCRLSVTAAFWNSVGNSALNIMTGFVSAVVFAAILSGLSYRFELVRALMSPFFSVIKSTPVASVTVIFLIWMSSASLPIFVSFLMSIPIIYINLLSALDNIDKKMTETAQIYRTPFIGRLRLIILPAVKLPLITALSGAIGLAWKSGVAAELIAISNNSIGQMLYTAKMYLATAEVFAWTVTVIVISIIFEKIVIGLIKTIYKRMEKAL